MPRKRIAPMLDAIFDLSLSPGVGNDYPVRLHPEVRRRGAAELRALLAVARAAMQAGPYHYSKDDLAMGRALRRLERVSGGAK